MEAACDGDVFKPTNLADDPIMLNIDSTAVVRNVAIFQHFLLNWKIWEKAKQGVLEMLLATIDILVHGSHSYYTFNIIQFQKAQLVQQILIGCQVRLITDNNISTSGWGVGRPGTENDAFTTCKAIL